VKYKGLPESDYRDISTIDTSVEQNRNPAKCDLRPVYGFDTETRDGNIFLLADSDGLFIDKNISAQSVIDFLFDKKYQNTYNVFFNLKFDAAVILKLLGDDLKRYLLTRRLEFFIDDYRIKYIPDKCLTISKGHKSVPFYDVKQFFEGDIITAYEQNIGPVEPWYKELKQLRDMFSARFYRRNTWLVRRYCIQDCIMAKALGEKWLSLYHRASGIYPRRLLSSGYLVEKAIINRGVVFPKYCSIAPEIQALAYRCSFGGRFEMAMRGFIGDAHIYDVNSAHPDKIAKLPDLEVGEWVDSLELERHAALGYFKIRANIPADKHLTPFVFKANGKVAFPSGKFITYATIDELRACENPDYYEIMQAYQFIPNDASCHPYEGFINDYYRQKQELKDAPGGLYLPFKIMLNSVYGKTGEVRRDGYRKVAGNFYNPVIFAHIPGGTRAQLYRAVIENHLEKDVVFMATDSICTTKDLGWNSGKLGAFSCKGHTADLFCIQNGINRWDKEWKKRGFGNIKGRRIENTRIYEENGRVFMRLKMDRVRISGRQSGKTRFQRLENSRRLQGN
jgi:hypothetical protein